MKYYPSIASHFIVVGRVTCSINTDYMYYYDKICQKVYLILSLYINVQNNNVCKRTFSYTVKIKEYVFLHTFKN